MAKTRKKRKIISQTRKNGAVFTRFKGGGGTLIHKGKRMATDTPTLLSKPIRRVARTLGGRDPSLIALKSRPRRRK